MKRKLLICFIGLLFTLSNYNSSFCLASNVNNQFKVNPLPYDYDSLQPYIDKETMILHHDKHYQAYIDKLNNAILKYPKLNNSSLTDLLTNIESLPSDVAITIKNNAGGAYNHSFFFDIMSPNPSAPSRKLIEAIERDFESLDNFKNNFKVSTSKVFGSGWTWLVSDKDGKLSIINTQNQDSPITIGLNPIIGIDLWEHAYYLKYKNLRTDYVDNWFKIINWDKALENYNTLYK